MSHEAYLVFYQGTHGYAIENSRVVRNLTAGHIYKLPIKETMVRGLLQVDEQLAAVVDVEAFLFHREPLQERYIIVLKHQGEYVGVCAADIAGIQELDEERWQPSTCKKLPYSIKDGDRELYHLQLDGLEGGDGYDQAEG